MPTPVPRIPSLGRSYPELWSLVYRALASLKNHFGKISPPEALEGYALRRVSTRRKTDQKARPVFFVRLKSTLPFSLALDPPCKIHSVFKGFFTIKRGEGGQRGAAPCKRFVWPQQHGAVGQNIACISSYFAVWRLSRWIFEQSDGEKRAQKKGRCSQP